METTNYNLRHAKIKARLRDCGIYHVTNELVGRGLVKSHPQNKNYLGGRTKNENYLNAMENLLDIILNE